MEQRIGVVTLGVEDLARARSFYEEGLGWRRGNADEGIAFYQLNGIVLALFSRAELARDAAMPDDGAGFRAVTLAFNTRTREEVGALLEEAERAGGRIVKPAEEAFWGGYSGYFADPDGHLWEVAWNPFWTVTKDGRVLLRPAD